MNISALVVVIILAAALLAVFGALYNSAAKSQKKGELAPDGLGMLRWAFAGQIVLLIILAITALFT